MADKMQRRNFTEVLAFDAGSVRFTKDKYLVANPKIARTGIQIYSGEEMGKKDMAQVRVWRPAEEVFSEDALHSFAFKPVTNDHPQESVTADNWKKLSIGTLSGDVARDGESMRIPLVLMDAQAINDWKDGKRQLSAGYACDIEWVAGKTPEGEAYDAIQRNIRANHVALVDFGRAGSEHRIGDNTDPQPKKDEVTMKTITIDGLEVQVEPKDAQIIQRHVNNQDAALATLRTELATAQTAAKELKTQLDAATATIQTKDAEIATVKKQVTDAALKPEQIDQLVKDRAEVMTKAKTILGDKLDVKMSDADIRKACVEAKMGDKAKGWNADQIAASFEVITEGIKLDSNNGNNGNNGGRSLQEIANAFSQPGFANDSNTDPKATAYDKMISDMANAYKNPGATAKAN